MKRFIVILAVLLPALTGRAQEVEMFSLRKEIPFPGAPKEALYKGFYRWSDHWKELDFAPWIAGYNAKWSTSFRCELRNISIQAGGREYLCHMDGNLLLQASDGSVTISLHEVDAWHVESKSGWITHIGMIPLADVGYWQGTARNRKERISIRIKDYLNVWFDSICSDLLSNLETFPLEQVML